MIKTLTKHGNSYALIIDRAILQLLKIRPDSPLEISTDGHALIVQPIRDAGPRRRLEKVRGRSERRGKVTLQDLRRHRDEIVEIAARHGATDVRVFGSVVRGSAGPESDIDLLVTFGADRSLFDQTSLIRQLTELLGHDVDVVSDRGLNHRLRDRILDEAIPL